MAADKIRLSLDVSPDLNDVLESLAADIGGTKSDALRQAVKLMKVVVDNTKDGKKKFGFVNKDQEIGTEIVGLLPPRRQVG